MYLLIVGIYEVGMLGQWLQFMDTIVQAIKGQGITDLDAACMLVKSLLHGDAFQVFQNKEVIHKERDSPVFTVCLAVVTKHVFPAK
eukprot:4370964-Ditylum_brightwellii.AAC.1